MKRQSPRPQEPCERPVRSAGPSLARGKAVGPGGSRRKCTPKALPPPDFVPEMLDIFNEFAAKQEPLGAEFSEAIFANIDRLYEE